MYKLKKEFWICCSHRLNVPTVSEERNKKVYGRCNNEHSHGHNYKIVLTLSSQKIHNEFGMVMNFSVIKEIFKEKIDDIYDHQFLNNCAGFENLVPTAENMCKVFYDIIKKDINMLSSIEIFETNGASAIYEE